MEWEPVRIPKQLFKEITQIVETSRFWVNEHEFIRDAVREKIATLRMQNCEEAKAVGS